MGKGETSRKKILMEAFRLFAQMPYERVSFSLMEEAIGISRGSMIYYFKNKEGLFREIVQSFIFGASSIRAVPDAYKLSLYSFYSYFIEILEREKEQMSGMGVANINEALMRIENSALTYIPNFKSQTAQWYEEELQIWESVIEHAISTGEIKKNIAPVTVSHFFEDCYIGKSFHGVFTETGYDTNKLKQTYDYIYSLLK